jgi:hypothetical protein
MTEIAHQAHVLKRAIRVSLKSAKLSDGVDEKSQMTSLFKHSQTLFACNFVDTRGENEHVPY